MVGPEAAVRAAIAAGTGRARSLAADPAYQRAAAGEPAGRVLDAYLPAAGLRRLLEPRGGVVGAIATMLDRPSLEGTAISLSAVTGRRGGADPQRAERRAAGAAGAVASERRIRPSSRRSSRSLPSGSTLMLDVDGLDRAAPQLLRAAATAGFAANVAPLLARLGAALTAQGVNVHAITSIFHGETAVALSPGPDAVARDRRPDAERSGDPERAGGARGAADCAVPGAERGAGQIPGLADQQVGDVTVHELGLGPGLQVDFAVFNGLVVVSTSISAIDEVASRSRSLAGDNAYKTVLSDQPEQVSSVLFTDFSQLLSLGEQTGLTSGARMRELLPTSPRSARSV